MLSQLLNKLTFRQLAMCISYPVKMTKLTAPTGAVAYACYRRLTDVVLLDKRTFRTFECVRSLPAMAHCCHPHNRRSHRLERSNRRGRM